jgi:molybdopterin-binding protein
VPQSRSKEPLTSPQSSTDDSEFGSQTVSALQPETIVGTINADVPSSFDDKDEVVSLISRQSIDTLKQNFRDQVDLTDWAIIKKMKVEQGVP